MKRETAEKIAKDFLNQINPEMWDGNGKKPKSVNSWTNGKIFVCLMI